MHAQTTLVLFTLSTMAGGAFATLSTGRRPLPLPMAIMQACLSIVAFLIVLATVTSTSQPKRMLVASLGLLAIAATAAVPLFAFHLHRRALPQPLAYLHAGGTCAGYLCMAISVLSG